MNMKIFFCIYVFILNIVLPSKAFAYIDPGTGSMVLQIIIAAVTSIFYGLIVFKNKIITLFRNIFKQK